MLRTVLGRAAATGTGLKVLTESGIVRPYPPQVLAGILRAVRKWGTGPAGGFAALAVRAPHQVGLIDELGSLTYRRDAPAFERPRPRAWRSGGSRRATASP